MQPRRDHEAALREADRGREQVRPRQLAVACVRARHQRQRARDARALAAGVDLAAGKRLCVGAEEPVGARRCRCRLAPVDRGDGAAAAVVPDEERAAAQPRVLRLDHSEHEHRRDRGVGGAAAPLQHLDPRRGRTRVGGADDSRFAAAAGSSRSSGRRGRRRHAGGGTAGERQRGGERHQELEHRRRGYSLPTASAMEPNPSRCISASSPRVIVRAMPGPS